MTAVGPSPPSAVVPGRSGSSRRCEGAGSASGRHRPGPPGPGRGRRRVPPLRSCSSRPVRRRYGGRSPAPSAFGSRRTSASGLVAHERPQARRHVGDRWFVGRVASQRRPCGRAAVDRLARRWHPHMARGLFRIPAGRVATPRSTSLRTGPGRSRAGGTAEGPGARGESLAPTRPDRPCDPCASWTVLSGFVEAGLAKFGRIRISRVRRPARSAAVRVRRPARDPVRGARRQAFGVTCRRPAGRRRSCRS